VARSCSHCSSGKAISITYSDRECVFVASDIQHAMRMHHIAICGCAALLCFATSSHKRHDIRKIVIEHTMCVFIFSTPFFPETFLILRITERDMIKNIFLVFMSIIRHPCQIFTKLEFSRQIFEKCSNIKFSENPFSGSRVVPCGETDGQTRLNQLSLFATSRTSLKHPLVLGNGVHGREPV